MIGEKKRGKGKERIRRHNYHLKLRGGGKLPHPSSFRNPGPERRAVRKKRKKKRAGNSVSHARIRADYFASRSAGTGERAFR